MVKRYEERFGMNKKGKITIGIIACVVVIIIASICYNNYNKNQNTSAETAPVYNLIKVEYFAEGTYNDYKALLTSPNIALPQKQFQANQKTNKPSVVFRYDSKTPESISKHLKAIEQGTDGNTYKVYYLQDVKSTKDLSTAMCWVVTKQNGKWLIKNA
jgi:Tfp pilus assembly protein PilE